ncbi:MAG: HlyC/CorC family transporter [Clostridiales bacterium]|nr:HlyC/CorC family transporter [Clostridiales bacterium]
MDADPAPAGNLWLQLLLLLVLILFNAFFAASEIAIISLNDNKLRKLAEEGHKRARQVLKLTADSSHFLATIQIGVTLAGFLTSATAAQSLASPLSNWFIGLFPALQAHAGIVETASVIVITLIMSYFSLVLGELVPKRIAMQKAEALSFAVIGILRVVAAITRPFVWLLSLSTNVVVRLFGMDPHADEENVTEEEIRMLVDAGEEKGVIEESQKDMINNIFEFDDLIAEDIMTPRTDMEAVELEDGLAEALRVGMEEGFSRLPVYEDEPDNIIGLLYIKDLLPFVGTEIPADFSLRSLLREAYFVPGTKKCGELFTEMTEKRIQMAVVVDEYGGVAGIVTMEDLLESIVGNIQDEFDHEEEEVTQTGEHTFEVDGSLDIEELSELLDLRLPEGEYDTVAGFIMDRLGRIPRENEHPVVIYENAVFTVQTVDDRRIEKVHIEVMPLPSAESSDEEERHPEKSAGNKFGREKERE